jgi:hypothetical protein
MKRLLLPLASVALITLAGCSSSMDKKDTMASDTMASDTMASDTMMMPFSGPDSVNYSQQLWASLGAAKLVGDAASNPPAYKGVHPHGAVLTTKTSTVNVDGHSGKVIVKKNYGGEGVSVDAVNSDPAKYLKAVTVMFKRETGYDADNQDWFWVKYKASGELHTNDKGMQLAGRVAKGKPKGCIACHTAAPGGDYIYTN